MQASIQAGRDDGSTRTVAAVPARGAQMINLLLSSSPAAFGLGPREASFAGQTEPTKHQPSDPPLFDKQKNKRGKIFGGPP